MEEEINVKLNTIVVLPIKTISSDESQISLAAGLTQDIAASLTRIPQRNLMYSSLIMLQMI